MKKDSQRDQNEHFVTYDNMWDKEVSPIHLKIILIFIFRSRCKMTTKGTKVSIDIIWDKEDTILSLIKSNFNVKVSVELGVPDLVWSPKE